MDDTLMRQVIYPDNSKEAVHIIDGLMKNQSDIQPDTIHADIMWNPPSATLQSEST
jgi:hypothetical protein